MPLHDSPGFVDMSRFFAPRSVALVGATEDVVKFGGKCTRFLIDFGYQGIFYPVNPKRSEIFGRRAYPSLAELPQTPDHVGLILPAEAIPGAVRECVARGVRFATVFSAGFAESGTPEGAAAQQEIVSIARAGGLRLMGPNCNGMVSWVNRLIIGSTQVVIGDTRESGDIGIVSQSGGAGQVNVMWRAMEAGLRISHQVSSGNDADLSLLDYMAFLVEDPDTRVILALAEKLADGDKLRAVAARAAELDKPILMVKVGRSEAGARAAASHTGSVTGADEVCDAALRQMGIVRVDDCSELYQGAMLLRNGRRPRGRGAAATSISGGNLVMMADLGAGQGIEWPAYGAATQEKLRGLLPSFSAATNPTDLTAAAIGSKTVFADVSRTIGADPAVDVLVPVITFSPRAEIESLAQISANLDKPVAILWTGRCLDDRGFTASDLVLQGHAVYRDALPCLKAMRAAMQYGEFRAGLRKPAPSRPAGVQDAAVRSALTALGSMRGTLSEHRSKSILGPWGLPFPREELARDADHAARIAAAMGVPVGLKVQSPDIAHKTEAGALLLGLQGEAAVRDAHARVLANAHAYRADARIEGVLVQEMVPEGLDVLIGVSHDVTFGPVITVGLGGIYVEVMKDLAFGLPPFGAEHAHAMLRTLRSYPLLEGVRGQPPLDVDALVDCIVRVGWFALDCAGRLDELDLNPVRVLPRGRGVRVIDALVVAEGPRQQPGAAAAQTADTQEKQPP